MKSVQCSEFGARENALFAGRIIGFVCACVFFVLCCLGSSEAQSPQRRPDALEKKVQDLEREVARLRKGTEFYHLDNLSENLNLCGRRIPLGRDEIRERFEREYFQLLENKGILAVIVKRYLKYFNMVNEEIQKMSLPQDLIFLMVAESYLNPRVTSSASAVGLWQFMKETAKMEGLYVNDHVDERYNVKRATRSALNHLKRLHGEFGDWLIAMAAYNAGRGRLREAIENQETRDFFDLYLPEETERYVLRIVVLKEIITNRERYGLQFDDRELYRPLNLAEVSFEALKDIHAAILSKTMDVSYKAFRDLNVHLKRYRLPKGSYTVNVPLEKKEAFLKKLRKLPYIDSVKEN